VSIQISRLDPAAVYRGIRQFDCGHAVINRFVHDSLLKQVKKKLSVAYVLTDSANDDLFVGFFTIAQHALDASALSSMQPGSLPRKIPCSRLIMLGVDKAYKKQKLGLALMKHAFEVTKSAARQVGSYGLYLDADPGAVVFYKKLGFVLLEGDRSPSPSPMFIALASIA
jgi:GNAT superfamily N-acetyltransferase